MTNFKLQITNSSKTSNSKQFGGFGIIILALFVIWSLGFVNYSVAQTELRPLMPPYWINGTVPDAGSVKAAGREVVFYLTAEALTLTGRYATASIESNRFMLNGFTIFPDPLVVGQTYQVATVRTSDNYGASGTVTISGIGWDEVKGLVLVEGGGVAPPSVAPGGEPAPRIKLWFNNRLYQPALVAAGEKFVVSPTPAVRVETGVDSPYTLAAGIGSYTITVDGANQALSASNISAKVFAAGTSDKITSLNLSYAVTDPLSAGEHIFKVSSASSGLLGTAATSSSLATVEVLGGPLRLIGTPITYPSPYSITKNKIVTIQYGLSANADIDIYLIAVDGTRVKKFSFLSGQEGGSAGINKVTWDGRTDMGALAGNAIYVGTIVARAESKLLGKVKLTIVD